MHVYIKTYGCTLNQADTDIMKALLEDNNISLSQNLEDAQTVILNTCTVKKPTEQKILHEINKLRHSKKLIVTGCMASANADIIKKYAPEALILTTSNLHNISQAVNQINSSDNLAYDRYSRIDKLKFFKPSDQTIAKVPINDGCLSSCNFCETKFARGPLNSFSEELILKAVKNSVEKGAREIQITSQDIGAYGADRNTDIANLMEKISAIHGDFIVRIGMLNPEHLHKYADRFIRALKGDKFYKFVHIPIQSGSNKVLEDMGRRYTVEQIYEYISMIRAAVPQVTIETDIIVGYPTETERDFNQTLDFIKIAKPDVTNISKFSIRHHAKASKLKQLSNIVVKKRSIELSRTVREVQKQTNSELVGRELEVIVTELNERSFKARTSSYKQVILKEKRNINIGERRRTRIYAASYGAVFGV